ncbi:MAG: hypothetical protein GYA51_05305 [Candidatus Methanofastidiosa archaeon]|jgi:predicted ferric reductase|nr:hypothetical protein [Candidatus Methanofastidiosa archaeon]
MLFLYQYIGPKQKAIVKHVKNKGEITEIKFEVNAKKFRFVPGQFVFIKFINLEKSFELFPFSISCSHKDDLIRISAKRSGDFTSNILPKVKVGDIVYLYGPYGKFGEKFLYEKNDMLWIAGGIGVTPFLSMIHEASDKNIDFVWASKDKKDAIYDKEIKEIISDKKSIRYNLWISKDSGRISAHKIMKMFDSEANIKEKLIFICGPTQMMMDIANQFVKIGVPPRHIIFEDFNLL